MGLAGGVLMLLLWLLLLRCRCCSRRRRHGSRLRRRLRCIHCLWRCYCKTKTTTKKGRHSHHHKLPAANCSSLRGKQRSMPPLRYTNHVTLRRLGRNQPRTPFVSSWCSSKCMPSLAPGSYQLYVISCLGCRC